MSTFSDPLSISRNSLFPVNTHACRLTSSSLHLQDISAVYLLANRHKHLTVTDHPRYTYPKLGPPAHQLVPPRICYQITHAQTPLHTKIRENHKHSSPPDTLVADSEAHACSSRAGQAQGHSHPSLTLPADPKCTCVHPPRACNQSLHCPLTG